MGLALVPDLDGLLVQAAHLGVGEQLVGGLGVHPVGLGPLGQLLEVWNDEAGQELAAIADQDRQRDERIALQEAFDRGRGDVLSIGVDEDLLLAIRDLQEAFRVDHPDIARVKPAVRVDGLSRGLGLVQVALHDVRPAREDLAVGRDLRLDAGEDLSHGSETPSGGTVQGDHGARLRQSVPFVDLHAHSPEEFGKVLGERRAAGDRVLETTAQRRSDLSVDEALEGEVLHRQERAGSLVLDPEIQDFFPDCHRRGE